ncbi:hypothetical protein CCP2SC5_260007 [Azospirillaceae bacterium]
MAKTARRSWIWRFPQPPQTIWSILANTNHFNEIIGVPKHQISISHHPNGATQRFAHASLRGVPLEWEESPYEWIVGQNFRQERRFQKGPLRRLSITVDLSPDDEGSKAVYTLEIEFSHWLSRLRLSGSTLDRLGRTLETTTRARAAETTDAQSKTTLPPPPPPSTQPAHSELRRWLKRLKPAETDTVSPNAWPISR